LVKKERINNEFLVEGGLIKDGLFFPNGKTKGEPLANVVGGKDRPAPSLKGDYGKAAKQGFHDPAPAHFANFIDCVRNHTPDRLNAPVREGHLSSLLAHLGNTSYRLGKDVPFNQETKTLGDDKAALEAFESMKDHLVKAAKMNLDDSTYRLGLPLEYDAKTERFVDNDEANKLITGPYRAPYVVPEQV
jgi:hypothetical protein